MSTETWAPGIMAGAACFVFTAAAEGHLPFWVVLVGCSAIGGTCGWFGDRVVAWVRGPVRDR